MPGPVSVDHVPWPVVTVVVLPVGAAVFETLRSTVGLPPRGAWMTGVLSSINGADIWVHWA
ncbi:hypothetical protein OZX57_08370 [Bifidobacterium sp. ESL0682]|uniref:hypothetical protein n=1 Tax=Bifidobacterium sp. ESL0682 TaxID=2983212 RepID=UPI0023F94552|nr:hypothetical protein [Bifidobacterium sp. ESL0682]WEV41936.1 hypothetical protein OZX57_08370 [Bifidobacterium sp. ESL0682]